MAAYVRTYISSTSKTGLMNVLSHCCFDCCALSFWKALQGLEEFPSELKMVVAGLACKGAAAKASSPWACGLDCDLACNRN